MLVLGNVTNVELNSQGGGFGITGGLGRGQGGAALNYQKLNLETSGTHMAGLALEYASPPQPSDYGSKDELFNECLRCANDAAQAVLSYRSFALNEDSIKPGIFRHVDFQDIEKRYEKAKNRLESFQKYEKAMSVWEKTCVCMRCGTAFVKQVDGTSSQATFDIPSFEFKGKECRCPICKCYEWKAAEIYFSIKQRQAIEAVEKLEKKLREALDYAANPNEGGFFKKLSRKLLVSTPEEARSNLETAKSKFSIAEQNFIRARSEYKDLQDWRVCLGCEVIYKL